jgi:hypothetical protein
MKRISLMIGLAACIAIVGFGCNRAVTTTDDQKKDIDRTAILLDAKKQGLIMDTGEIERMKDSSVLILDDKKTSSPSWAEFEGMDFKTWNAAALADVTGGTSYGLARLNFSNKLFRVVANFGDLTQPTDGSTLQAWLVKRGDGMKVVNLGTLISADQFTVLTYATKTDLREYDFFVVTLQPPNSTIPGEHLLEGMIR